MPELRGQIMTEPKDRIISVLLRASHDLGHGGAASVYRIEPAGEGYEVTLNVSRPFPSPGERTFQPTGLTETLTKDDREVELFLRRLSEEHHVFDLTDLEPRYPFLHPTFYSFHFRDAAGREHGFRYTIEASRPLDAGYERLVAAFQSFFGTGEGR